MPGSASRKRLLIGRGEQLRILSAALEAATSTGRGSLVLLSGEPGIGKTRLAEESEQLAAGLGFETVWGRCHEVEGRPPFFPWIEVLRELARARGAAKVASQVAPALQPLAALVPGVEAHLPPLAVDPAGGLDSETARFQLFQSAADLLADSARERPLLVVLDDLHWADVPSLRLLELLAHRLGYAPLVVIGTYRDVDLQLVPPAAEIVARLRRSAECIELRGLTPEQVREFVASGGNEGLAASLTVRLYEATEGNPFFLDELVRLWSLQTSGPRSNDALPVTEGIVGAVRERLRGLPVTTAEALAAGAIAGRDFDVTSLSNQLRIDATTLLEQLRPAIERAVVREVRGQPGLLRFSHVLVRDAVRLDLDAAHRMRLHRARADYLASRHGSSFDESLAEAAHHFYEAAATGCQSQAIEFAILAGDRAMRSLAFEDAAVQFHRALRLYEREPTPEAARLCEICLRAGDAANRAGQEDEATTAFQKAIRAVESAGEPALFARAALGLCGVGSTWARYGHYDPERISVLRSALASLPLEEASLRSRLMARLATEIHWAPRDDGDVALASEAIAVARESGDSTALIEALSARLRCSYPEEWSVRLAVTAEILSLTGERGDLAVHALSWRFSEAMQCGDLAEAARCRARLLAMVGERRQPRDLWLIPVLEGQKQLLDGDLGRAAETAEGLIAAPNLSANGRMAALVLLFQVRREQGRHGELADGMRAFAYQSESVKAWRTNLAMLYAETGAMTAARSEIDALADRGLSGLRRDNTWMLAAAGLADAVAIAGTPEQAGYVYEALLPFDGRHITAASFFYLGPVSLYLGKLATRRGNRSAAERHLRDAIEAAELLGAPGYRDRAQAARDALGVEDASVSEVGSPTASVVLRSCGDGWMLEYRGRSILLKRMRGLDYLVRLVAEPGRERHVLDLATDGSLGNAPRMDGEALLDERAKRELQRQLSDLRHAESEAEANHDLDGARRAREQLDAIANHLAEALGLGGRHRRAPGHAERARAAVTKALRTAIRRIGDHHPELADLLQRTVRTGAFCVYEPLQDRPLVWRIEDN